MANITVRGIEALRPTDKEYKVTVDRGLYLRVAVDGVKTWHVRYVVNTKQTQARLPRPYGASGEEGYMSLAQALAENARIQSLAREGIDFQVQRAAAEKARKEAAAATEVAETPFKQLFETWMADGVSRKDGNVEIRRTFTRDDARGMWRLRQQRIPAPPEHPDLVLVDGGGLFFFHAARDVVPAGLFRIGIAALRMPRHVSRGDGSLGQGAV